jgi:phosphoglycolate phosphatase-like HAD superfamily hydrolase
LAALTIKESNIKTIIFDFDGTLAKLNIDFDLMRKTILEIISSYNIEPNDYWIILIFYIY